MSSGQKPRTPEYFPRMKYRARKRYDREAAWQSLPVMFVAVAEAAERIRAAFRQMTGAFEQSRDLANAREIVRRMGGGHR
ncbi:hypothetical protein [Nocardia sp. NPDC058633]|uniref:hypothetical protein n=1 Tax=Nocardia sp. NPDC058633 TaxID=3346568 RepID=UPI00365F32F9